MAADFSHVHIAQVNHVSFSLSGQDFNLGPYGTKVSKLEYDRLIAEWLARGRRLQNPNLRGGLELTVVELAAAYKRSIGPCCNNHIVGSGTLVLAPITG
jgi:hypothetical protein